MRYDKGSGMRARWIIAAIVLLPVLAATGYAIAARHPLIDKLENPPPRTAFSQKLIDKGARLAAIGGCHLCHTAPGGGDYAGNRPIATPFGTIYSTNITPALGSGIGQWSVVAFRRAMREGISRTGRHLYPAFPYPHFAAIGDADLDALYAFLMTRRPVETTQLPNRLPFPLDQRWLMSFWNLLFFHPARFRPDPRHDAAWNRGAYLVEGLGHCGDC
ncbi:MAG TPA: cytochrome c, partial [Stellaceae bacterium]|nr:cytochrome c [Stellaceae bacterium]